MISACCSGFVASASPSGTLRRAGFLTVGLCSWNAIFVALLYTNLELLLRLNQVSEPHHEAHQPPETHTTHACGLQEADRVRKGGHMSAPYALSDSGADRLEEYI